MNKNLKEKAISFKGKAYVMVADRVLFFNETYPRGSITTELVSQPQDDRVVIKATVKPNAEQTFTGYSQAKWSDLASYINKSSALENAETSAVGRALALMGIGVIDSIASIDEIKKAESVVQKIATGQKFTADEMEEAQQIAPEQVNEATREAGKLYREEHPPIQRNPGVKFGKIATGARLKEKLNNDEL